MRLPELKALAQSLGLEVGPKVRRADLIAAIREMRGPARRGRPPKNASNAVPMSQTADSAPTAASSAAKEEEAGVFDPALRQRYARTSPRTAEGSAAPGQSSGEEMSSEHAQQANDRTRRVRERSHSSEADSSSETQPRERTAQTSRYDRSTSRTGGRVSSYDRTSRFDRSERNAGRTSRYDRTSRFERTERSTTAQASEGSRRIARTTDEIVLPERSSRTESNVSGKVRRRERTVTPRLSDADRMAALNAIGDAAERRANSDKEEDSYPHRTRRSRRERNRNRNIEAREQNEQAAREEDMLLAVAGILDQEGNQHFLRTGGYLPGANDALVPQQIVKQYGLRRGDAIVGAVKRRNENEGQQNHGRNRNRKFSQHQHLNQLVQVNTINSLDPERSALRPEFNKLTPLYPQDMLRMETTPKALTPRAIDLVAPIGKGQRGLIVSPPKAGKTMIMQQIAMAIAANNPKVHLMVVLVDERPEEVTDMKRLVKGEVIASTFDRPASDHAIVAELAIERAKRLVELGQDVVVLLDSLTRLSRAYNLAAPASGRILSGGVDAGALYPPKRFFGAARNIENGGSLTIIASALVETGSKMDEVIFEEFKGTGNMELRLSRQLADRRIFPAIDVNASGTRREELLFSNEELKVIWQLRRALGTLDVPEASDFLLGRLRKTQNNAEFLVSIMRSMQASGASAS
ncbi:MULTISPECIES: transcription termination factor Rho [unclassified Actinobaculum]|uniref:transcription termination factor Rho n=1 Tax=unclassified Actinobaculum TaxID=2609299 RepID=UPI000D529A62|nr:MULTISPECIES: transcription termination factor Rho [unclassified Actinobaculum]AWE43499.1 transcription termination factor Rho [Actinobaculum sp. 313]RTE49088.1 transcription termination factor Rho [Actinobaculum sp. 352]